MYVVDDEKTSRERVALAHEEIEIYDASYYEAKLVQCVERILPFDRNQNDIRREFNGTCVVADWV